VTSSAAPQPGLRRALARARDGKAWTGRWPRSAAEPGRRPGNAARLRRPGPGTPGLAARPSRRDHVIRGRFSSRSPGCAGTAAGTARSRRSRTSSKAPTSSPTRCSAIARQVCRAGLQGGAVHPGGPAGGPLAQAREWLDARGYDDTLSYVRAIGPSGCWRRPACWPHLNPGVLGWADFQRLKPVAPSMGMMLETTAARLFTEKGARTSAARTRTRRSGCGCWRTRGAAGCVHDRDPHRHRRDARRARRLHLRDPSGRPRVRRHPGSHRAELPGQAGHQDARRARRRSSTTWPPPSPSPG